MCEFVGWLRPRFWSWSVGRGGVHVGFVRRRLRLSRSRRGGRRPSRPTAAPTRCGSPPSPAPSCRSTTPTARSSRRRPSTRRPRSHDDETRTTDDEGALVFRYVEPGKGYVVKQVNGPGDLGAVRRDEHHRPPRPGLLRRAGDQGGLRLPHHPRRHEARHQRHAARPGRGRPVPDGDRVLGLRPGQPRAVARHDLQDRSPPARASPRSA